MPKPKFIFSIIGGTKNFQITDKDRQTEKAFKSALMRAAQIRDCWIITSGVDAGATQLISKAMKNEKDSKTLTVLGIANRKRIFGKYTEFKKETDGIQNEKNNFCLNVANSSFIIVDGEEDNNFRLKLESHILNTNKIPFFLFVINGGFSTLRTIATSLEYKMQIVIVSVSFLALNNLKIYDF